MGNWQSVLHRLERCKKQTITYDTRYTFHHRSLAREINWTVFKVSFEYFLNWFQSCGSPHVGTVYTSRRREGVVLASSVMSDDNSSRRILPLNLFVLMVGQHLLLQLHITW